MQTNHLRGFAVQRIPVSWYVGSRALAPTSRSSTQTIVASLALGMLGVLHATPAPAQCVAPPSGLVGWWPGDGNATDIVGRNDGSLRNGATFAIGQVGQAFSLDGVNDYVAVPASGNLNLARSC